MIPEFVATVNDLAQDLRFELCLGANDKERSVGVVVGEDREHVFGECGRCVVERERDDFRCPIGLVEMRMSGKKRRQMRLASLRSGICAIAITQNTAPIRGLSFRSGFLGLQVRVSLGCISDSESYTDNELG